MYLGLGYNIYKGNPLGDRIDPGFRSQLFAFSYDGGQTTDDNRYLIPDNVEHHGAVTCSYQATTKSIEDTITYQKSLFDSASISGGGSAGLFSASFSLST